MRFRCFYIISLVVSTLFIISCSPSSKMVKLQKSFIPEVVSNVYLGMTLKELKEARGELNLFVIDGVAVTRVKEEYTKDSITLITYQFDKRKILYEIIIEYATGFDAAATYLIKYGATNNGKEWLFTLGKKMKLKIWIYQNRLCMADSRHFKN